MKKLCLFTILLTVLSSLVGCTTKTPIEAIDFERIESLELQIEELKQDVKILTTTNDFLTEENVSLHEEMEFIFDDMLTLQEYYQKEYDLRNVLDIKAHRILQAMVAQDLTYLESVVAQKVTVYENYFSSDFGKRRETFDFPTAPLNIRQRWFSLSDDRATFNSGYEFIILGVERINLLNFEFIFEEGKWKLNSIRTE
ncbi:hypothetical protein JYT98_00275 [bacterium AH-315-K05]|nr:hypothetical protein [bacterium AH-315-K05]MBN4074462.1 hypothetical protein [bacterium AH-315-E09]